MNTGFNIVNTYNFMCPTMADQYFNTSVEAMLLFKQKTWALCRND